MLFSTKNVPSFPIFPALHATRSRKRSPSKDSADRIEALGIRRSFEKAEKAAIILYLFDLTNEHLEDLLHTNKWLQTSDKPVLIIGTKNDLAHQNLVHTAGNNIHAIYVSCKKPADIERIKQKIVEISNIHVAGQNEVVVTNIRHYEALCHGMEAVERVLEGLETNLSGDLLAEDTRECLHHLGEITGGEIASQEILNNIFSKFCIGK